MRIGSIAVALAVALSAPIRGAEDLPVDAAREVFEKNQNAVVWVSAVMKMRAGGALGGMFGRQEQKVEAVGTIIHESGLTVLSYTNLDPSALYNAMTGGGGGEHKIEFKTELSGVKIRLADGTEVPAKLVLKDEDLDLAFVLPTDAAKKNLPFLKLDTAGDAPKVKALDPLIDRQPAVAIVRVAAVVNKPRTFYACNGLESLGTPAFAADKRPLGIVVMRKQSMDGGGLGMMMSGSSVLSPVVVPATDVMEVAQQALAKKDEPAPEPAKDEPAADEAKEEPAQDPTQP
jgi:hypothetical protein